METANEARLHALLCAKIALEAGDVETARSIVHEVERLDRASATHPTPPRGPHPARPGEE